MARVAFVIWLVDSFGEREHALRFAAGLGEGWEPVFVVAHALVDHVAPFPVRAFSDLAGAREVLEDLAPDLIVCSEFFNFPAELRAWLAASGTRLATFDGTGMGVAINTRIVAEAPIEVPPGMLVIRPCPINDPAADGERLFHWSIFRGLARGAGGGPGARRALLAFAPWALAASRRAGLDAHYEALLGRLADAFVAVGEPVTLVVVSPEPRQPLVRGPFRLRFVEYLPRGGYERLLLSADLVVSDNAIQTSVGKALVAGIPTMVVVNSQPACGPIYDIFPLPLRMSRASAYLSALRPVELGDPEAIAARIAEAWRGEATPATAAYLARLAPLRDPPAILAAGIYSSPHG